MYMVIITLMVCGVTLLHAQPPQLATDEEKYLQFDINTNKKTYVRGEPVVLNITFKNISDELVQFASILSPTSDIEIRVYRPDQFPWRHTGIYKIAIYPRSIYWLEPNEERTTRFILLYDKETPGEYLTGETGKMGLVVRMAYSINDRIRKLQNFQPQKIEIVEGSDENKKAFALLNKEQIARELAKTNASEDNLDVYKRVRNEYPDSVFAPYCLLTIGGYELEEFHDDMSTSDSSVLEPFKTLIDRYPDFELLDLAYYNHAVYYYWLKEHDEARHWLSQLYYKFPDSPKFRRGDPLFKEYYFKDDIDLETGRRKKSDKSWIYK